MAVGEVGLRRVGPELVEQGLVRNHGELESEFRQRLGGNRFEGLDRVEYLASQLEDNSTRVCSIRRWYVKRLVDLDDPRARPTLEKEHRRRRCAQKLIARALARWSEES